MLRTDSLQMPVVKAVLSAMKDACETDSRDLLQKLLQHLKWLNLQKPRQIVIESIKLLHTLSDNYKSSFVQALPDIFPESEHKILVEELTQVIDDDSDMLKVGIEAISQLSPNAETNAKMRILVMEKLNSSQTSDLPFLIKWLYQQASVAKSDVTEFIRDLRYNFDFSAVVQSDSSDDSTVYLIVDQLCQCFSTLQGAMDAFLRSVGKADRLQLLDLVLLLCCLRTKSKSKQKVHLCIQDLILNGIFTGNLIDTACKKCRGIFSVFGSDVLALIVFLLQNEKISTSNDAVGVLKTLHLNLAEQSDVYIRSEAISQTVALVGQNNQSLTSAALDLLLYLSIECSNFDFGRYVKHLVILLDYLEIMGPANVQKTYQLLFQLSLNGKSQSGNLADELMIVVRKQLCHQDISYQKSGIIGVLQYIKVGGQKISLQEFEEIMQLAHKQCCKNIASLILLYETLNQLVMDGSLSDEFIGWIEENIAGDFQTEFLLEAESLPQLSSVSVVSKLLDSPVCISLISEDSIQKCSDLQINALNDRLSLLNPLFDLMISCVKALNQKQLDSVDVLLGCGFVNFNYELQLEDLRKQSSQSSGLITLCLFYQVNYIRKAVNLFIDQKHDAQMMETCKLRLKGLVTLEGHLKNLCQQCSLDEIEFIVSKLRHLSSNDPASSIQIDAKSALLETAAQDESIDDITFSETASVSTEKKSKSLQSKSKLSNQDHFALVKPLLCELQAEAVMIVLKDCVSSLQDAELCAMYVEDIAGKIEARFSNTYSMPIMVAKRKNDPCALKFDQLLSLNMDSIMQMLLAVVPAFGSILSSMFQADADLDENQLQIAVLIFKSLKYLASSKVWKEKCYEKYINIVTKWFTPPDAGAQNASVIGSLQTVFGHEKAPLALKILIIECLNCIQQFVVDHKCLQADYRGSILDMVQSLLINPSNKRLISNDQIMWLLSMQFKYCSDSDNVLQDYISKALKAHMDGNAETLLAYPLLTKETFPYYYKSLFDQLCSRLKQIDVKVEDEQILLKQIALYVKLFQTLISFIKQADKRPVLLATLKFGRVFVEAFNRICVPALDSKFRRHRHEVVDIIKECQIATRQLQSVCGYSKEYKDVNMTNAVPLTRKSLEQFIYKIKAMLSHHNVQGAFWIGNLKHRDLKGEVLSSQMPVQQQVQQQTKKKTASKQPKKRKLSDQDVEDAENLLPQKRLSNTLITNSSDNDDDVNKSSNKLSTIAEDEQSEGSSAVVNIVDGDDSLNDLNMDEILVDLEEQNSAEW
ncbi:hypothetical protein MP228_000220 [Amoeboaphelidium protococcarum]|nr:hypothetical protein MP228_000220 [Amoeboaphelidium protococcarum]